MRKAIQFNLQKYINKLKVAKAPAFIIGQENGMGLQNIYHPAFDRTEIISKNVQISEVYGTMNDHHPYMSEEYKNLLLSLKEIDNQYILSSTLEKRVQLSKDTITHWKNFIEHTHKGLPNEEYTIRQDIHIKLEDIFMRFKVIIVIKKIEKK